MEPIRNQKNKKGAQTEPVKNATDKPVFCPRIKNENNQNYLNVSILQYCCNFIINIANPKINIVLVLDKAGMAERSNATGLCPVFLSKEAGVRNLSLCESPSLGVQNLKNK